MRKQAVASFVLLGLALAGGLVWWSRLLDYYALLAREAPPSPPEEHCAFRWAQARYAALCAPALPWPWDANPLVDVEGYVHDAVVAYDDDLDAAFALPARVRAAAGGWRFPIVRLQAHRRWRGKLQTLCRFLREAPAKMQAPAFVLVSSGKMAEGSPFDWGGYLHAATDGACDANTLRSFLDSPKVLAWFVTQHGTPRLSATYRPVEHPKLHLVPLGVPTSALALVKSKACASSREILLDPGRVARDRWVYVNFNPGTNSTDLGRERQLAWKQLSTRVLADPTIAPPPGSPDAARHTGSHPAQTPPEPYLFNWYFGQVHTAGFYDQVLRSASTPSPAGTGFDCFRHWESLALGSTPIILHAFPQFDALFDGLPALFLDSYDQISGQVLLDSLRSCHPPHSAEKLTMRFWNARIEAAAGAPPSDNRA
jgi:hypothetical protein